MRKWLTADGEFIVEGEAARLHRGGLGVQQTVNGRELIPPERGHSSLAPAAWSHVPSGSHELKVLLCSCILRVSAACVRLKLHYHSAPGYAGPVPPSTSPAWLCPGTNLCRSPPITAPHSTHRPRCVGVRAWRSSVVCSRQRAGAAVPRRPRDGREWAGRGGRGRARAAARSDERDQVRRATPTGAGEADRMSSGRA